MEFHRQNQIAGIAVLLISFLVYLKTTAPTVTFWDTGEFISASYILGVPHPPGAPFHTLLGRFFSMLPLPGEVAFRVNLISGFAAAATALLIYLCVVRLLRMWMDQESLTDRIAILVGGVVAALTVAFSTSFWSNATEAEVYALSMLFTLLAYWLALRWDDAHKDRHSDRMLLFVALLFGLGAGVHLQCLLTVPGILILVFMDTMEDRSFRQQWMTVAALTLYPFLSIVLPTKFTILITAVILAALIYLRPTWRTPWFWIAGLLFGALGYSTYLALVIRSGLDPIIDMNNPETWENFKAFLSRQQYGTHFIFPRRGEPWLYQMNIHLKYFLQQFPFYDGFTGTFRRAVSSFGTKTETIRFSLIPLLFGIGGALVHLERDWKRFTSVLSMFVLMGVGLVLYLNMPDPEPREREYIFVGAYTFFGIWIGVGAAAVVAYVGRSAGKIPAIAAAAIVLLLPIGTFQQNLFSHDRSRDYVAYDYAYNILQSCAPNAILFTNGDNDTYPLWFLQTVKGVRRDVRVANLSLLKTTWYAKQLRDLEPKITIPMSDAQIEVEVIARPWRNPEDITIAGITVKKDEIPTAEYPISGSDRTVKVLETHTWMIWYIVHNVNWTRPIQFAVTVPSGNMAGLRPFLIMEGMTFRLDKDRALGQFDTQATARNLFDVYHYRGVADQEIYKDAVARRLLGNYLVVWDGLVRAYLQMKHPSAAYESLSKATERIPHFALENTGAWNMFVNQYRQVALQFAEAGNQDSAVLAMEKLLKDGLNLEDRDQIEQLIHAWKAAPDSAASDPVPPE